MGGGDAYSGKRKKLSAAEASNVERIATNAVGAIAMNGGYPRSCTAMIGGEPGMGKSTLCIQLARYFPSTLYIAAEQSASELQEVALRIGTTQEVMDRIEVFDAMGGSWIDEALNGTACELVVLDSIQGMCGIGNHAGAQHVLKELKKHCVANRSVGIAIDQATKGDYFAGQLNIQHEVDATLILIAESKDERLLLSVKNRHGPSGLEERLLLGESGLLTLPPREKPAVKEKRK
jgi:DNA repair protein RadA/Sms